MLLGTGTAEMGKAQMNLLVWGRAILQRSLLVVGCYPLIACGSWLGNPKKPDEGSSPSASLIIQGITNPEGDALLAQNSSIQIFDDQGNACGSISLSEARLVLKEITLEKNIDTNPSQADSDTDPTIPFKGGFKGPFVANLLNNSLTPTPGIIEIPSGSYLRAEGLLSKLTEGSVDRVDSKDTLTGHSLRIAGNFKALDGRERNLAASLDIEQELPFAQRDTSKPFIANGGDHLELIVRFRLFNWFKGTAISGLSGSGDIILDGSSRGESKAAYDRFKENVTSSATFSGK